MPDILVLKDLFRNASNSMFALVDMETGLDSGTKFEIKSKFSTTSDYVNSILWVNRIDLGHQLTMTVINLNSAISNLNPV